MEPPTKSRRLALRRRWDPPSAETPARARGRVDVPVQRVRRMARVGRVSPI
jgi:hypothetical protein